MHRIVIDIPFKTTPERDDNLHDAFHIILLNIYLLKPRQNQISSSDLRGLLVHVYINN